ncbi:hypothetical protein [Gillisia sp. CAL575]|uniref:hypothetical protein n=1 Tax=Gillisia sp. CAL575 TaxID=985255 RepID=UPI00039A9404|nr:hypothetical protein [Gillisia sp. CAL575]
MEEEKKDIYQTAEVILLIIKYEGEIEDVIEYPTEFEAAYKELLHYKIIKRGEDKYLPDLNFHKALELGFTKYVETINTPSKFKQYITSKPALGVLAGAVLVTAGYLMRTEKKYTH